MGRLKREYSNMICCPAHSRFFSKTGISMGFSLYNIFTGRNSEGCSLAQEGAA
jgi:hypothetical protein